MKYVPIRTNTIAPEMLGYYVMVVTTFIAFPIHA